MTDTIVGEIKNLERRYIDQGIYVHTWDVFVGGEEVLSLGGEEYRDGVLRHTEDELRKRYPGKKVEIKGWGRSK